MEFVKKYRKTSRFRKILGFKIAVDHNSVQIAVEQTVEAEQTVVEQTVEVQSRFADQLSQRIDFLFVRSL